jgi:hypothetical protein
VSDYLWPQARFLVCRGGYLYRGEASRTGYKCGYCKRGVVGEVYVERDCRVCKAKKVRG